VAVAAVLFISLSIIVSATVLTVRSVSRSSKNGGETEFEFAAGLLRFKYRVKLNAQGDRSADEQAQLKNETPPREITKGTKKSKMVAAGGEDMK
jgi:hypothetical protein